MNRIFLPALFALISWASIAQKTYFVYLQTDRQSPFYVIHNNKNFSSTASGYLILPKLTDGVYSIKLGFPNDLLVQDYDLVVEGHDAGYLVKNFGDKGWGLADLQSGEVQMSGVNLQKREGADQARKLLEAKKLADSLQVLMAEREQARITDSLLAIEKQKITDSLLAIEKSRIQDSLLAIERKRIEDSLSSGIVTMQPEPKGNDQTDSQNSKSDKEKATTRPDVAVTDTEKKKSIPEPAKAEPVSPTPDSSAGSSFKTEAEIAPVAEIANEQNTSATAFQKRVADSLLAFQAKRRADSIRQEDANREAQLAINEAKAVMNRVLGSGGPSTGIPAAGKNEVPAETGFKTDQGVAATTLPSTGPKPAEKPANQKENLQNQDTIVVKIKPGKEQGNEMQERSEPQIPKTIPPTSADNKTTSKPEPRFLDMEMSAAGTEENKPVKKVQEKNGNAKSNETRKPSEKKQNKLVSNNSNTRIVEIPAADTLTTTSKSPVLSTPPADTGTVRSFFNECGQVATDKDFFNLRKKMAADEDAEEMLSTARKVFKEKCFSSEQVRNLCVLFLKDQNKYRFLDMAYLHTSDPQNFRGLADLLSEEYYINRFRAMLRD